MRLPQMEKGRLRVLRILCICTLALASVCGAYLHAWISACIDTSWMDALMDAWMAEWRSAWMHRWMGRCECEIWVTNTKISRCEGKGSSGSCIHYIHTYIHTLHYITLHYITIQYNTVHLHYIHYIHTYIHTYNTIQYNTIQYNTIQYIT